MSTSDFVNEPVRLPDNGAISSLDSTSTAEHGHLYQTFKQGRYVLPNDSEEQKRLNTQHRLLGLLQDGQLGFAPVGTPKAVLDIGTGT